MSDERHITESAQASSFNSSILRRPLVPARYERNIELQAKHFSKVIARKYLRDGAIHMLVCFVRDLAPLHLDGPIVCELLSHPHVDAFAEVTTGLGGRIDAA